MQARRITIDKKVSIDEQTRAEALNLSRTGMFVLCRRDFAEGANVEVRIDLAGRVLSLPAKIQRVEDGFGFALSFVDLPAETSAFLGRYIERRAGRRWDPS